VLFQANDESLRGCLGGCVFVYSPLVIVNGGGETGTLHNTPPTLPVIIVPGII